METPTDGQICGDSALNASFQHVSSPAIDQPLGICAEAAHIALGACSCCSSGTGMRHKTGLRYPGAQGMMPAATLQLEARQEDLRRATQVRLVMAAPVCRRKGSSPQVLRGMYTDRDSLGLDIWQTYNPRGGTGGPAVLDAFVAGPHTDQPHAQRRGSHGGPFGAIGKKEEA
eukprot:CAMPEP_0174288000 /NCGR_PEP_ID=MMETSP0809-20121228/18690_1 /TAXON_ID=73025 ORGANISM="Eutreptiella gymnastica-like, Strain CCMP1594" /NCGR_SAMPLE_ID=MMETSP0809 /ASSEMBLY_ACC=CAM_ASM_000658 /LENGTH=171 /DNA_ID=CAMNT_0015384897 /DNA_START=418 /DNA_END=935 /DNA_ORIENTATION=-